MPCTHTNSQFAELISQTESMARRAIYKLIKMKLIDAVYHNKPNKKNAYRDLTTLVGVEPDLVIKRKAAQLARQQKAKKRGEHGCATTTTHESKGVSTGAQGGEHGCATAGAHGCAAITTETKRQLTPPSPASAGQTSAAKRQQTRDAYSPSIREEKEPVLIEMYRNNPYNYRWLIDELRPEIKEKAILAVAVTQAEGG